MHVPICPAWQLLDPVKEDQHQRSGGFNPEGGPGRGRATQLRLVAMAAVIATAMATYL